MVICKKDRDDALCTRRPAATSHGGGPVYFPRRRMSKAAEQILARPLEVAPRTEASAR